jgi:hypothetical protein
MEGDYFTWPKAKAKAAGGGAVAEATQRLGSNFLAREIKAVRLFPLVQYLNLVLFHSLYLQQVHVSWFCPPTRRQLFKGASGRRACMRVVSILGGAGIRTLDFQGFQAHRHLLTEGDSGCRYRGHCSPLKRVLLGARGALELDREMIQSTVGTVSIR